jgi:ribosomal protein S18 acetylase RimI-like enzyme
MEKSGVEKSVAQDTRPQAVLLFPEQHAEAATMLGRAFINDPVMWAILPDVMEPAARARRIAQLFTVMMQINRRLGQPVLGVVDHDAVVGAAVIEGAHAPSMSETVLAGLRQTPQMIRAVGLGGTNRALRLADTLYKNRPKEPHLYLSLLGVDPDYQRRHFGIALLDHLRGLAAVRSNLTGVYLETATEANVPYYSRAGYEVLGELFPLGVRMWRMMQPRRRT